MSVDQETLNHEALTQFTDSLLQFSVNSHIFQFDSERSHATYLLTLQCVP